MEAKIKIKNLPSAPKPTKAVRVYDVYPKFAETLEKKQKEIQDNRTIHKKNSLKKINASGNMTGVCREWTDLDSERLYRLRKAGMTILDISKEMHRSKITISKKIKELGYGTVIKGKVESYKEDEPE